MYASGLMCLAKNHGMAKHLSAMMQNRLIDKHYTALLCGIYATVHYPTKGKILHNLQDPKEWVIKGSEKGNTVSLMSERASRGDESKLDCITYYERAKSLKFDLKAQTWN